MIDILLKGVNRHNIEHKMMKAIEIVNEGDKEVAKKILKDQGNKTSNVLVQEKLEAQYLLKYEKMINSIVYGLSLGLGFKIEKAADDDAFVVKGKIFYNPKTGKPLTIKEWNLIKDAINKFLGENTKDLAEKIAYEQASLGTILQRLESQGVRIEDVTNAQVKDKIFDNKPEYERAYDWFEEELYPIETGMQRIGENITNINDEIRNTIVRVINDGIVNRKTNKEISRDMLDSLAVNNRDWERIVAYESQYHFQTGYLSSEVKHTRHGEKIYMQAISQPDACKHCKSILNGRVYIVTTDPNKLDENPQDKHAEGYIMVGATNIGTKAVDYGPAIPLHPFCRCRWVRAYPYEWERMGV